MENYEITLLFLNNVIITLIAEIIEVTLEDQKINDKIDSKTSNYYKKLKTILDRRRKLDTANFKKSIKNNSRY